MYSLFAVLSGGIKEIKEHFIKKNDSIYLWPQQRKLCWHFTESLPTDLDFGFHLEEMGTWKRAQPGTYPVPHRLRNPRLQLEGCSAAWCVTGQMLGRCHHRGTAWSGASDRVAHSSTRPALQSNRCWLRRSGIVPFGISDKIPLLLNGSSTEPWSHWAKTLRTALKVKEALRSE